MEGDQIGLSVRRQAQGPVHRLLARIASKVSERTRRPWFDLQRNYFYKSKDGVTDPQQLCHALARFHIMLNESEAQLLFSSFVDPQRPNYFDFKRFAGSMFPEPGVNELISSRLQSNLPPINNNSDHSSSSSLSSSSQLSNNNMALLPASNFTTDNIPIAETLPLNGNKKKTTNKTKSLSSILSKSGSVSDQRRLHSQRYHESCQLDKSKGQFVVAVPTYSPYPKHELRNLKIGQYAVNYTQPR